MFVADHDHHGSAGEPREALDGARPVPVMELTDVHKRFGATRALDGVGLTLHAGEVHALLGENGAGKSTLIKMMPCVYTARSRPRRLEGERRPHAGGGSQRAAASPAIYQEPIIFPDLHVAENIFIGHRDAEYWSIGADLPEAAADPPLGSTSTSIRARPPHPDRRGAAGGRDREGDLAGGARADHGRADRVAVGPRGDRLFAQVRGWRGRRGAVHQPPSRRGLRHRRPNHRAPGRPPHLDPARAGDDRGSPRPRDGGA